MPWCMCVMILRWETHQFCAVVRGQCIWMQIHSPIPIPSPLVLGHQVFVWRWSEWWSQSLFLQLTFSIFVVVFSFPSFHSCQRSYSILQFFFLGVHFPWCTRPPVSGALPQAGQQEPPEHRKVQQPAWRHLASGGWPASPTWPPAASPSPQGDTETCHR